MFSIPDEYGFVLAACGVIGITQTLLGGGVMGVRSKVFKSKEFTEKAEVKALAEQHQKYFKNPMNNMGYPDMGNGRYSQLLPYEQWVELNNAQRAHYNMIEDSATILACLITSGLEYPRVAAALGVSYAISRFLYARGYKSQKGADGRVIGAASSVIISMGLKLMTIAVGLQKAMM